VLVTDGYPQGCDDEHDTLEAVAAPGRPRPAMKLALRPKQR
jgi:hypothetical protein